MTKTTRKQRELNKQELQDLGVCEDCKQAKPDVHDTICPYAEEIHGIFEDATLCDACYNNRCMDI